MSMCGMGANITENSMSRAAKCQQTVLNVCDNYDHVTDIPYAIGKHSLADDAKLIVKELHERSKVKFLEGCIDPFPTAREITLELLIGTLLKAGLKIKRTALDTHCE